MNHSLIMCIYLSLYAFQSAPVLSTCVCVLLCHLPPACLVQNMVGRGEVDDDLQPEVQAECSKFGEVTNCLIFEVTASACIACVVLRYLVCILA